MMRYIDLDEIELEIKQRNPSWFEESKRLTSSIMILSPSSRKAFIKKHQRHWGNIKEILATYSFDKCWYCESKRTRGKWAIDHFRPKNAVYGCPSHPGYWWLAFTLSNYRYCCDECNELTTDPVTKQTGGKHSYFPLQEGSTRATQESEVKLEQPLLIDPVNPKDCSLIAFDKTSGNVISSKEDELAKLRVAVSVKRYHLNKTDLSIRRFKEVCCKIDKLVAEGTEYICNNDELGERRIEKELIRMIQPKAEFSIAAKCILMYHQDKQWIQDIVLGLRMCK